MSIATVPNPNRRRLLAGALGLAAGGLTARAAAGPLADPTVTAAIRGAIDASEFGIRPDAPDDQSRAFGAMLDEAAARGAPVFLPPGAYRVSNIELPDGTRLVGVPGATRIVYGGEGFLLAAEDAARIDLTGLSIDGANLHLGDRASALVEMRRVAAFTMDRCEITGSAKSAIALEASSGSVERSRIGDAADYALYSVEAGRLRIADNSVADCGNGGILVHRWQPGDDGSIVTGNRIERIGARNGGTGQYGNGINIFRADNVMVGGNHVSDCAFSAIRANSAGNVQIVGNQCLRSGETAIYSEFAFEGAVIGSNVVDGAAIGISIANLDHGGRLAACHGNLVRNLVDAAPYEDDRGFGIGIAVEADAAIVGNVVEDAPRYGVMLGWGPFLRNVAATGNVVRQAGDAFAVSVVDGAGSALISENVIQDARHAIVGYRWTEAATGDLAIAGAEEHGHIRIGNNMVS